MAALFALLLVLAALRPLALPDEGRYGEVGRWVAVSGDWLAPRLNGLPFFHKPPLLYWLEAAAVSALGATAWSVRLVPALHAGLMLVALFLAVRALERRPGNSGNSADGERLARRAALMLGSSPAFLLGGQYVNHDMMVATWIGVTIACFATAFLHGAPHDALQPDGAARQPHTGWALAGFAAAALGVLSKGLIGVALPGLVLLIWLAWTRQLRRMWRLPWLRGLALLALLTVPWFVAVERRFPGALGYLFGVQQFSRYVGSGFNNVRPWWFYLACLMVLLLPWSFFALYEGVAQARRGRGAAAAPVPRAVLALCWIWVVAILVFFSIPRSKLIGYMLPVMPPLALLAAVGWGRVFDRTRDGAGDDTGEDGDRPRHRRPWLLPGVAVAMLVALGAANVAIARHSARHASAKAIADVLACAAAPDDPVYAVGGFPYDLPFYARMTHPLIAVQDWARQRATAGDDWRRELFEAGDFDPATAARVLQAPPAALAAARAAPNAWVVAPEKVLLESEGFNPVARSGHWTLYASPAMPTRRVVATAAAASAASATSATSTAKGPEAAENESLPGCQHRRHEPGH
jgi:hypothetical protein